MVNIKIERLNHAVQEELSKILLTEVKDEDIHFVTITDCDISSDLSYCKVYVTVLDKEKKEQTMEALENAAGFLRGKLSERIEIRHTPILKFLYDESIDYGERIEKIFDQLKEPTDELSDTDK